MTYMMTKAEWLLEILRFCIKLLDMYYTDIVPELMVSEIVASGIG